MDKDVLIEIDMKVFDESLNDILESLRVLDKRVDEEIARLTYWAGSIIVREAKNNEGNRKHKTKNTGSLLRSINCAPADVSHSHDQKIAEAGGTLEGWKGDAKVIKDEVKLQIGSWMDYAYYVERGTKYMDAIPYLLPALESKFKESVDYISNGLKKILDSVGRK